VPNTICISVIFSILSINKNILFCDTNVFDGNINLSSLKSLIKKNKNLAHIIIAPHMYGNLVNIKELKKICKKEKIFLVEDCAQALGTSYGDKFVGSFGEASIFSFGYSKNIDAGGGGCVVVNDKSLAKNIFKNYKNLDKLKKYEKTKLQKAYRIEYLKYLKNPQKEGFIKKVNLNEIKKLFINYSDNYWEKKVCDQIKNFQEIKKIKLENYDFYKNIFYKKIPIMFSKNNVMPWRFNLLLKKKIRDVFINKLWNEGLHVNLMYPSVSKFLFFKGINSKNATLLEQKIVNFPLDKKTLTDSYKRFFKKKLNKILTSEKYL